MKVGIVGFSGAGKTTIFNALTGLQAEVGPHGRRGKANLGMITVPDPRVEALAQLYQPKRVAFAKVEFVDLIGPTQSSSSAGSSLGAEAIAPMREADALVQVVCGFANPALADEAEPARDLRAFEDELILTDLIQIEKRLERLKKEAKKGREPELLQRCQVQLEAGQPLRRLELAGEDRQLINGFRFLSQKPFLALLNSAEPLTDEAVDPAFVQAATADQLAWLTICGQEEMEIAQLDAEAQLEFLRDLGLQEPASHRFIRAAYQLLDLISFLTAGSDECRAWPIKRGTTALKAAGKIHSDIERGFIRAEVVAFDDFIALGSEARCREAGKLRLEGKNYPVRDGDIIHFRFNV
ncbi:MAG TPA: redox-regulated ATPase YchF [Candidatus Fraserbacteria bacterium]|nr:redox-regulated ATPase YchF [Candidatus Fraserbacteria bacterium]